MNKELEVYKKWAPDQALWTQWVKPVIFMNMTAISVTKKVSLPKKNISWTTYDPSRILIVDLPSDEGLNEGLSLATIGYRPIPLYNGVPGGKKSVISNDKIIEGLNYGARLLAKIKLVNTANPVFLLDSNRLKGNKKKPGTFDNRWCVVAQDMPSAKYLQKQGIQEIVVRTDSLQKDLAFILYHYQKEGILIYLSTRQGKSQLKKIPKPKGINLFYRFLLLLGLTRSAAGGFGMTIPEVSSGGGGYRAG